MPQAPEEASNGLSEDEIVEGIFLPVGVDLHQITIVPKVEWERIQDSLDARAKEAARARAERKERKDLHLKSQALVKNWTNTIAGMSQAKLKAKKIRQEREEKEKRLIDLEEVKYQAQKRKELIEEAQNKLYHQNERVKGFHRAFLLTEVLKERDAQIEFKKKNQNLYQNMDDKIEHERQQAILKEEEKVKEQHRKRLQLNQDQLEQIKEHEHLEELAKLANIKEGQEIQALTRLYHLEMQEKEHEEYKKKLERKRAHQEHVSDQIILKAIEKQKQEEEDEKIRLHFKAKQVMNKLRKAKEEEMLRLMEKRREDIFNRLLVRMQKKEEDEDERIAREIAETEEEEERERKAKEEKNKAELESIKEHRIGVMKVKEEKEKQEKLEAKEKLRELMEADRIFQELEKDKKHRFHCANLKQQDAQIMQIAEKMAREDREKQDEAEYVRQKELIALCKEQEFQEYAKKVVDEESKTAQNLYPLFRAVKEGCADICGPLSRESDRDKSAAKVRYTGDTAQEMKLLNDLQYGHTKSRLGFTW
ncbi:cilia- and flagella- associated protein 210 isoform X2 [Hemicordylus capensis]|uniref:cilia- and flagella- associated protein 210 isoform X2 n=1 Tax=Hemicordylus capensis TaxID=884348 RepID=UPI002302E95B|nr:cilia- and flagella- associated protein 210 isoform X2 [Hemicordylus capensis]